jgi:uncharacterized membrane protein
VPPYREKREGVTMSDLIAVGFKGEDTADQVLNKLQALQKEYLIDLEDSCVVVRDQAGRVHLKQAINLTGAGAAAGGLRGAMWGTLIGLLFLNPLIGLAAGAAVGAGSGALAGALSDYGIDDQFIRSVGSTIEPGSSALFVLVRSVTADRVLPELQPFEGTVLRTSLSNEQEARLQQALQGVKPEA